jgi:hypothetical protein
MAQTEAFEEFGIDLNPGGRHVSSVGRAGSPTRAIDF